MNIRRDLVSTAERHQYTLLSDLFFGQKWQIRRYDWSNHLSVKLPVKGQLRYSLVLQCHTGQTVLLQALTLAHMRSNDYSATRIIVDFFFFLSTLLIMSTNRFRPIWKISLKWCTLALDEESRQISLLEEAVLFSLRGHHIDDAVTELLLTSQAYTLMYV